MNMVESYVEDSVDKYTSNGVRVGDPLCYSITIVVIKTAECSKTLLTRGSERIVIRIYSS